MYKVNHPSYIKEWTNEISLGDIQAKLGINKAQAVKLVQDLINKGSLTLIEETENINLDLNQDGKVDKKDFTKASKVLNKAKKRK